MKRLIAAVSALVFRSIGLCAAGLVVVSWLILTERASAQASIFYVIPGEVEQGEIEFEFLNGIDLGDTEHGEERSVHEIAIGYGITDYWKLTGAFDVVNPAGESAEIEAVEIENLFLLPGVNVEENGFALGLFAQLDIKTDGGLSEGALAIGPVYRTDIGLVAFTGNLFVEMPFAEEEDTGLYYATQFIYPVTEQFGIGVENFGIFREGEHGHDRHVMGPALFWDLDLGNGHILEPKLGVLFGLNDEAPDAALSFNLVYKIGQE